MCCSIVLVTAICDAFTEAKHFIQAASEGSKEKVLSMLENGTDPSISDEKGRTALHVASAKGRTEIGRD